MVHGYKESYLFKYILNAQEYSLPCVCLLNRIGLQMLMNWIITLQTCEIHEIYISVITPISLCVLNWNTKVDELNDKIVGMCFNSELNWIINLYILVIC